MRECPSEEALAEVIFVDGTVRYNVCVTVEVDNGAPEGCAKASFGIDNNFACLECKDGYIPVV